MTYRLSETKNVLTPVRKADIDDLMDGDQHRYCQADNSWCSRRDVYVIPVLNASSARASGLPSDA